MYDERNDLDSRGVRRNDGSILIGVLVVVFLLGALFAALASMARVHFVASVETLDRELAVRAAETGISHYLGEILTQPNYLDSVPTPQSELAVGGESFVLLESNALPTPGQWEVLVEGRRGDVNEQVRAVIGWRQYEFPAGIAITGTGNPADVVLSLQGGATISSYDPDLGGPSSGRMNAGLWVNGSAELSGSSSVLGDLTTTGTTSFGGSSSVTGTLTENGPQVSLDLVTDYAGELVTQTQAANDNAVLAGIFGSDWSPVGGPENYGDLEVKSGNYVIPPGNYRFRKLVVKSGATVTFDTSTGPSTVVYMGGSTGPTGNALTLKSGSEILVDNGGSANELTTILGPGSDFAIESGSIYAQPADGSHGASVSRITSAGGGGAIDVGAQATVYGRLLAPDRDLTVGGNAAWHGSAAIRSLTLEGGSGDPLFAVDEDAQGSFFSDPTDFEVYTRWSEPL